VLGGRRRCADEPGSDHRDTPPEDIVRCRGRSPGSRVAALVRPSRNLAISVTRNGRKLAAHSCGGSPGLTRNGRTGFPLSSGCKQAREPRRLYVVGDSPRGRNRSWVPLGECMTNRQQIYNTASANVLSALRQGSRPRCCLVALPNPVNTPHRERIEELAIQGRLPAVCDRMKTRIWHSLRGIVFTGPLELRLLRKLHAAYIMASAQASRFLRRYVSMTHPLRALASARIRSISCIRSRRCPDTRISSWVPI